MQTQSIDDVRAKIPELLEQVPYLKLLVLFGSRARGNYQSSSDWDFAMLFDEELRQQYEAKGGWDRYRSWAILQKLLDLGDDEMDWVDLKDASEILAHSISRDGIVLYSADPEVFPNFQRTHLKADDELKRLRKVMRDRIQQKLKELRA
jgi:predicted nucleotidyltransferase